MVAAVRPVRGVKDSGDSVGRLLSKDSSPTGETLPSNESQRFRARPQAGASAVPRVRSSTTVSLVDLSSLPSMSVEQLAQIWRREFGRSAPARLPKSLLMRLLAYRLQAQEHGDLSRESIRMLDRIADELEQDRDRDEVIGPVLDSRLKPGSVLVREHNGEMHRVMVLAEGYAWKGWTYPSLSAVARAITGTTWNGYAFFGLKEKNARREKSDRQDRPTRESAPPPCDGESRQIGGRNAPNARDRSKSGDHDRLKCARDQSDGSSGNPKGSRPVAEPGAAADVHGIAVRPEAAPRGCRTTKPREAP